MAQKLVGGLIFHDDKTGDCAAFTRTLAKQEAALGVDFTYETTVKSIDVDAHGVRGLDTTRGPVVCSRVVICTGYWTPALLQRSCGLRVPIYPVRGYSMTVKTPPGAASVRSTILDEASKIALTNLGRNILRVAGTAEICNPARQPDLRRRDLLARVTAELFPAAITSATERGLWHHGRPMTPDGTPIVGPTEVAGLWINSGHGTLGFTQSFGSACLIADAVLGRETQLNMADYELARYGAGTSTWRNYFQPRHSTPNGIGIGTGASETA